MERKQGSKKFSDLTATWRREGGTKPKRARPTRPGDTNLSEPKVVIQNRDTDSPWSLINKLLSLFSCSVVSDSLWPQRLHLTRLHCSSPSPRVCSNSFPLSQWCHPTTYPLFSPSPLALNLSQYQGLFQWVSSSHQVTKELELQLQHGTFQWIFRVNFL